MTFNEYQVLARRTVPENMGCICMESHALHGMVGEIGEIHSLYQKRYQGHNDIDMAHLKKELGDLLWFIAEYCSSFEWSLDEIAELNIDKLKARYPEGFDSERSIHRAEGDI